MPAKLLIAEGEKSQLPKRKILCIEDEPDIQKILQIALNYRGGYQVVTADNGLAGLELAEKENFDLIILDALTPVMDGYETCKRLKENPPTKEIPVIFLAGKTQAKEIQKGLALGALDYLTKPFDPLRLPDQIEEILERMKDSVKGNKECVLRRSRKPARYIR